MADRTWAAMPTYEFEAKNGDRVERIYPMSSCPERIRVGRRWYRKIISGGIISAGVATIVHQYPRVDRTLPRFKDQGKGLDKKTGFPIVHDRKHERDVCARKNLVRD